MDKLSNVLNEEQVEELQERLNDAKVVKEVFEEIEALGEEADDVEREAFEDKFYKAIARAKRLIAAAKFDTESSSSMGRAECVTDGLQKIKIPTFAGNYDEWLSFRDLFTSLVLQRENLSKVRKFHHLRTSLSGEALQFIQNYELTEESFEKAWQELKEQYDNEKIIADRHIKALFNLQKMDKESPVQFEILKVMC